MGKIDAPRWPHTVGDAAQVTRRVLFGTPVRAAITAGTVGVAAGAAACIPVALNRGIVIRPGDKDDNRTVVDAQRAEDRAGELSKILTKKNKGKRVEVRPYEFDSDDSAIAQIYHSNKYPQTQSGPFREETKAEFFCRWYRLISPSKREFPQETEAHEVGFANYEMDQILKESYLHQGLIEIFPYVDYTKQSTFNFHFASEGKGSISAAISLKGKYIPQDHLTLVYSRQRSNGLWVPEEHVGIQDKYIQSLGELRDYPGAIQPEDSFIFVNIPTFDPAKPYVYGTNDPRNGFDRNKPSFDGLAIIVVDLDGRAIASKVVSMDHWGSSRQLHGIDLSPVPKGKTA